MDPNKIHIDELVRQRLQGGEEEPRPGAWISMRELLDKQMPIGTRPLGGFAWGKSARWTTALVLLTLLAGGYGAMDVRRSVRKGVAEANQLTRSAMDASTASSTEPVVDAQTDATAPVVAHSNATVRKNSLNPVSTVSQTKDEESTRTTAHLDGAVASSDRTENFAAYRAASRRTAMSVDATVASETKKIGEKSASETAANTSNRPKNSRRPQRGTSGANTVASASSSSTSRGEAASDDATRSSSATPVNTTSRSQNRGARTAAAAGRTNASTEAAAARTISNPAEKLSSASRAESPRSLRNTATRGARSSGGPASAVDSAKLQVQRDTLHPIRIAHRYLPTRGVRGGRYSVDTLASEPLIIERPIPSIASVQLKATPTRTRRPLLGRKRGASVTASTPAVAANGPTKATSDKSATARSSNASMMTPAASQPLLASAAPSAAAGVEMVPLSSKKVSSTSNTKLQYSAQEQIQDAMRRTQFLFGQMRLYSGVTGGFNASVGGTSMGGFHAGLFGLLAINDHWGVGLEGKFVQRFNRGTELHDPYFHYRATTFDRFTNSAGDAYNVYRVTQDSFDHYYKLSTIETVEFPLYARYSFRRFQAFGGANLTVGLRVKNIERVDRFAGRASNGMDTVLASTLYAPPTNTATSVALADFGPRFGLGYTAGVGYQASPAVLVDVRMTQLMWDNRSAGAGGLRVSQTYYRVPSLQLSIGYRFSQRTARR